MYSKLVYKLRWQLERVWRWAHCVVNIRLGYKWKLEPAPQKLQDSMWGARLWFGAHLQQASSTYISQSISALDAS
jgi:hypothetical protein